MSRQLFSACLVLSAGLFCSCMVDDSINGYADAMLNPTYGMLITSDYRYCTMDAYFYENPDSQHGERLMPDNVTANYKSMDVYNFPIGGILRLLPANFYGASPEEGVEDHGMRFVCMADESDTESAGHRAPVDRATESRAKESSVPIPVYSFTYTREELPFGWIKPHPVPDSLSWTIAPSRLSMIVTDGRGEHRVDVPFGTGHGHIVYEPFTNRWTYIAQWQADSILFDDQPIVGVTPRSPYVMKMVATVANASR